MVKISIIMPSLNVANYIKECMESVISQTLSDIEIICVDAGSSDGTNEILEDFAKRDNRIRIIHSEIKSYGYQVNVGIRESLGEYVGIVETDDYIETDMYEYLYKEAKKHSAEIVKGSILQRFEDYKGNYVDRYINYVQSEVREGEVYSAQTDPYTHIWDASIWNGIYKKNFLLENNILLHETPGAAFQDVGFMQQVLNAADKIVYLSKPVYHYRPNRPGNSTWSNGVINNVYQEYKWIFDMNSIKTYHVPYIYTRMAIALIFEFDKAIRCCNYRIEHIENKKEFDWLLKQLQKNWDLIKSSKRLLPENLYGKLCSFLWNIDEYIASVHYYQEQAFNWLKEIGSKCNDKDLVVFGAGYYGEAVVEFILRSNFQPIPCAVIDNDSSRWGHNIQGFLIQSPLDIISNRSDSIFLIANHYHYEEMKKMLLENHIDVSNIIILNETRTVEAIKAVFVI